MTNKEKAMAIVKDLETQGFGSQYLVKMIEKTLNQLEAPEPKKWEPRGGEWYLRQDDTVSRGVSPTSARMAGRTYRTKAGADCAAPLHRKLDRLVNWLVEHHEDFDGEFGFSMSPAGSLRINFANISGSPLLDAILSGEVEL